VTDTITKADLIERIRAEHQLFEAAIDGMTDAHMTAPGAEANWSVKDIAAHLAFWQQRAIFLLECARDGWQVDKNRWSGGDIDRLNEQVYRAHRDRPLADVLAELRQSQSEVLARLEATPEVDLTTRGRFDWLPNNVTLVDNITGETYEHYQEHSESLRSWRAKQP
jgi:hypothetical protein